MSSGQAGFAAESSCGERHPRDVHNPQVATLGFNIRTNHVHTVVSANCEAWLVLNALKANATRTLREEGCWRSKHSPWVRRGSKRRLWTEKQLSNAIDYVLYDQGLPLP